jgi:DNA polymerase-1
MGTLLLDTHSLFYRAFHALPPMCTSLGEPTNAVYGLSVLLLKLLREQEPEQLAFALDSPEPTFRHQAFDGYKQNRAATPRDLTLQFARLHQLIAALGAPAHAVRGFEADDVLATLSERCLERGEHVLVVSGDRDLFQLVRDGVDVLFVGARGKPPTLYDGAAVRERFGFSAERYPTYLALVGDSSDNLPKVPGIGESTAQKLVAAFDSAEAMLRELDAWPNAKVRDTLREYAEQIRNTERLARLAGDVPLESSPLAAPVAEQNLTELTVLFEELEFHSLLPRVAKLRATLATPPLAEGTSPERTP